MVRKAIPTVRKIKRKRYYLDGERVPKGTIGATEKIEETVDWYADIPVIETVSDRVRRRQAGRPKPKRRRVRFCANKRAAQKMLEALVDESERQAAGLVDYQAHSSQLLVPLIADFQRHLRTTKNRTAEYIDTTIRRIELVFEACGFIQLRDIETDKISCWLSRQRTAEPELVIPKVSGTAESYKEIAEAFGVTKPTVSHWRSKGAPIVPRRQSDLKAIAVWYSEFSKPAPMSPKTSDHYVTALKRFGNWMVRPGKIVHSNPFTDLEKLNDETDVRKKRRALSDSDFAKLVAAATRSESTFRGQAGADRAILYTFAAYSGLRASEIASLTCTSFDFNEPALVTVEAAYTKNGELAEVPLRSDLAGELQRYIKNKPLATISINQKATKIWPGTWSDVGAKMIRQDLAAANLPYTDEKGRDYDFHALRHQFITGLSRAGVSLKVAQELARHSKPELTANVYTHLSVKDTAGDVEKLPPIPLGQELGKLRATGTDATDLGTHMGTQVLPNKGHSGAIAVGTAKAKRRQETTKGPEKPGPFERVDEGTRTPNPWYHKPVL